MTLDGKIAPPPAASPSPYFSPGLPEAEPSAGTPAGGWITGSAARAHVHEQRHRSDAIVVGIGTVLADDPLLTDRSGHPRRRPLLRIILDSTLRLPLHSRLARSVAKGPDGASDVLLFCSRAESAKQKEFAARGLRVETISAAANGRPDFAAMLRRLGELEVTSLLLEGGSALNASALELGLVDKLFLYYAPRIFPGSQAVPFAAFSGSAAQAPVLNLKRCRLHRFDEDFAVEGYLHDPYQD
jgi:diaminohydroxyphosphoribosylaminopyrimidine deaminase/5-amino-6-(5-phosphoribosylamino)uracil reductase